MTAKDDLKIQRAIALLKMTDGSLRLAKMSSMRTDDLIGKSEWKLALKLYKQGLKKGKI